MVQLRKAFTSPIRITEEFLAAAYSPSRESQLAGIAALISIATTTAPPGMTSDAMLRDPRDVRPGYPSDVRPGYPREARQGYAPGRQGNPHQARHEAQSGVNYGFSTETALQRHAPQGISTDDYKSRKPLQKKKKPDHLVRNSLYLILSSGLQAAFGFAFWVITARVFSTTDLGIASSLISAVTVIAFIAILGLNNTFVRFLPTARNRNALMTVGILLVASFGAVVSLIYVVATPVLAPRLSFIEHSPVLTVGFVLLSSTAVINLLTDSVFIAARKSALNALIDGVIGGAAKLLAIFLFTGTGAYGLFCASTSGFVIAGIASLFLMASVLNWRPTVRGSLKAIKPLLGFSLANYAANGLGLLPILIVPVIVLDRLGASTAAYYFIDFQMATLLYSAAFAVEQNFLAEGSQANANWRALRKRGRRITIILCLPPCLVLIAAAHWVMLIFGTNYSQHGTVSLMILGAGAIPMAANNWRLAVLRLAGNLRAIIVSSAVYAVAICGLAWILAPHGLAAVSAAWPIGSLLSAVVAGLSSDEEAPNRETVRSA